MTLSLFKHALVVIGAAGTLMTAGAVTPKHGWLSTKDNYILNEKGNIVQLRGMSFYWSTPGWIGLGYYNSGTVNTLVNDWKCTVVRAAYDRNNGNDNGWNEVKTVIDAAIAKGIYVILDWHSHTAEQQANAAISFFTQKAQEYKNTPNVIFEVYNEPIVASGDQKDGSVEMGQRTWAAIKPYLTNVTKAIRNTGSKNLIILGTPYYCQHVGVAANDPVEKSPGVPYENVAYAFHFYAASHGPNAMYVERDGGGMEATYFVAGVNSIPLFVTEWGTTHSDGSQSVDETNTKWWFDTYLNKYHISHCNWSVSSGEGSSCFSGGTSPSQSGTIAKRYINGGVDEWEPVWKTGLEGPAKDSVFTFPKGFHQASSFNNYYGTHAESTTVAYLYRDKIDRRIEGKLGYTVLKVTPSTTDNWVTYNIKMNSATEYILVRYHSNDGTGTIEVDIDGTKAGQVTLAKKTTWDYAVIPVDIASGTHTLKFNFTNTSGKSYLIEWFELTNEKDPPKTTVTSSVQRGISTIAPQLFSSPGALELRLPSSHRYSGYSVIGANGRTISTARLREETRQVSINGIAGGIWFIKLNGENPVVLRAMVNGK